MMEVLLFVLILVTSWSAIETRMLRKRLFVWLLLLADTPVSAQQSPAGEVRTAVFDGRKLPKDQAKYTRYLTYYHYSEDKRKEFLKVLTLHVNNLSREAELYQLRQVSDTLVALEIDAYGWEGTTYGKLFEVDPWFHTKILDNGKKITAHAPWLVGTEITELVALTGSVVPILRADWFIYQTGEQLNRKAGYYDFLGLKKQADAEKLAGLDRDAAKRIRKELAAIVMDSQVALNNRQIFRLGAVSGGWWETRDVDANVEHKNALRNLDDDFGPPDALEIYFPLPNGLFGFVLSNNKGELQATAPDKIASDGASTNTDRRVRVGLSCIRCHVEGLRPVDDWSRKVFRLGNETGLGSPDREKVRRLRQLYLGPLQESLTEDRTRYSKALKDLTGFTPAEASKAYSSVWQQYESAPVFAAEAARELGCTEQELLNILKINLKASGTIDLALASWLSVPPLSLRREIFEEQIPVLMTYLKAVKP